MTRPYHAAAILDLKRGCTGIKIAKMANDHCTVRTSVKMTNAIAVKIYHTLIFQVLSRNESTHHFQNRNKYFVYACLALLFKIKIAAP